MYDCYGNTTVSKIYLLAHLFENVNIVKSKRSRLVNSERYLIATGFLQNKLNSENIDDVYDHISELFRIGYMTGFTETHSLNSLVPLTVIRQDEEFSKSISHMMKDSCDRQTECLKEVMDCADYFLSKKRGRY